MVFVGAVHNGWHKNAKVTRSLGIRSLLAICMMGILLSLFGCGKRSQNPTVYPFDVEKSYCYSRTGVIAGGDFRLEVNPEGVVEYYSYQRPVAGNESGMADRGADIFFVGLKEGKVEVTAIFEYPTTQSKKETFTLNIDKNLCVTKEN